jgi:16S rRNA processing protein RimM
LTAATPPSTSLTERLSLQLLDVGQVVRPHGVRGEVVVELFTNVDGRLSAGLEIDADGRSLTIDRSTPLPERRGPHGRRCIVAFSEFRRIEDAEALRGVVLRAPPLEDDSVLWVHQMLGAKVFDTTGQDLGTVDAVQANPASDLLVLGSGALVPLRFVVEASEGRLVVDPPLGLFDL